MQISQSMYRNISGTTKSAKALKFACSHTFPCNNIVVSNINLEKKDGTVETYWNSATGFGYGIIHPAADWLSSSDKECIINNTKNEELVEAILEDFIYTELWVFD